jgi:hypothetical protein
MSDTMTTNDDVSQETVGVPETETVGASLIPTGPSEEFVKLAAQHTEADGEDHSRDTATGDGGGAAADITSEPETAMPSFDPDVARLEQMRQAARSFNVPEQVVSSWQTADQAQGFMSGMQHLMAQAGQPQASGSGQQKPAALPALDYQIHPDWDDAMQGALGQVQKFGSGINGRLGQYEQGQQLIADSLVQLANQQQQTAAMYRNMVLDAHVKSLPPEVAAVFKDTAGQQQLQQQIQLLEAGAQALGSQPNYQDLVQQAVYVVAGPQMHVIERNRLEAAQAKKAKGVSPRPSSAKTTSRDAPGVDPALADFQAAHERVARQLDGMAT